MQPCPSCGNQNPDGAQFCDNCGASLAAAGAIPPTAPAIRPPVGPMPSAGPMPPVAPAAGGGICPQCHAQVMPGMVFCENCGAALQGTTGAQPVYQVPPPPAPVYTPLPATPVYTPPAPVSAYPPPAPPAVAPGYGPGVVPGFMSPARLVMPNGTQIQLAGKAEYQMGREDATSAYMPEVDLAPHGAEQSGVSRRHAKIIAQGGYFLEDLNSVNGTFLNRQKLLPGQRIPLNNGDEIRLGKLAFNFYTT